MCRLVAHISVCGDQQSGPVGALWYGECVGVEAKQMDILGVVLMNYSLVTEL